LHVTDEYISAGQYIPNHPTCGHLHGHTYFIRDLKIVVNDDIFLDFGDVKKLIKTYDHVTLAPTQHVQVWEKVAPILKTIGIDLVIKEIKHGLTELQSPKGLCEEIADQLASELLALNEGISSVSFGLYEGPKQGVLVRKENT